MWGKGRGRSYVSGGGGNEDRHACGERENLHIHYGGQIYVGRSVKGKQMASEDMSVQKNVRIHTSISLYKYNFYLMIITIG